MDKQIIPVISIIVPVYNSEAFLRRCIESVLSQTFSDFELILINDGSVDFSGKICDEYSSMDNRVVVIHKNNEGVSIARNVGLNMARGEWLLFIDSDDYVLSDYLECLLKVAEGEHLVISGYIAEDYDGIVIKQSTFKEGCLYLDKCDIEVSQLDSILVYGTPWGKLYLKSIVLDNKIYFNSELSIHEDHLFYFSYLNCISKIRIVNFRKYVYVNNRNSSLSRRNDISFELKLLSYFEISKILDILLDNIKISRFSLPFTGDFVCRLYISAVIISYKANIPRKKRLEILQYMNKKEILTYYIPNTFYGYIMKIILLYTPLAVKNNVLYCCVRSFL